MPDTFAATQIVDGARFTLNEVHHKAPSFGDSRTAYGTLNGESTCILASMLK
ncbi:hypothetical protein TGAMA5MH_09662 [Trichoderma gamsii]|uniref:Uncharacterized protein n=1 Tax=Trichoderma gamsii TaxID=398673 RepID=A0A2K0SZ88_9HYPO|nr:hypothetical protein TGAMA5MH_09662 [Trichoderma gamsii]